MNSINQLLDLRFKEKQRQIAHIIFREQSIRKQLQKLDFQSSAAELSEPDAMQTIGADILWKGWVGRTKTALNLELAQVLAQKEIILAHVRKAAGEAEVSKLLVETEKRKAHRNASSSALDESIRQHLLRGM